MAHHLARTTLYSYVSVRLGGKGRKEGREIAAAAAAVVSPLL